jgi:hypothetical protein
VTETYNYGPLAGLIGTWHGSNGMDKSPEKDGLDDKPYYETIVFDGIGDVENAETQVITALHYRQVVQRKSNDGVIHHETGYWMWDEATGVLMHGLAIPRGLTLLAGGKHNGDLEPDGSMRLEVQASSDDPDWHICQSPFMTQQAKTTAFSHRISLKNAKLSYHETITVEIYGRTFEHTDENELERDV